MPPETAVDPVTATELAGTQPVHDFSLMGLFLQADIVVQLVMLLLILASFYCWAIIFEKTTMFKNVLAKSREFEDEFWDAASLDQFHNRTTKRKAHPMLRIFRAGMEEWYRQGGGNVGANQPSSMRNAAEPKKLALRERINRLMQVTRNREAEKLERGLGFLATVGSSAPFIGLFGTVWGIMNSFTSIGASNNTSLAVVAPGIAEALFATAIGLFAAIPAVIFYNKFAQQLDRIQGRMDDFIVEFDTLLSRQMEA